MNILYIHGYNSCFKPNSEKMQTLSKLGTVMGITIDYTDAGFDNTISQLLEYIKENDIVVVVGTSLGGYLASHCASISGLPFVAINPSMNPQRLISSFNKPFNTEGCGLVLLDRGDEVIDSKATYDALSEQFDVVMFEGGNHRFQHMADSLDLIKAHIFNASINYGLVVD